MTRLRQERKQLNLTLTQLSAMADIAIADPSWLERGKRPAHPRWRQRLAMILKVPESELFPGVDDEKKNSSESNSGMARWSRQ